MEDIIERAKSLGYSKALIDIQEKIIVHKEEGMIINELIIDEIIKDLKEND